MITSAYRAATFCQVFYKLDRDGCVVTYSILFFLLSLVSLIPLFKTISFQELIHTLPLGTLAKIASIVWSISPSCGTRGEWIS